MNPVSFEMVEVALASIRDTAIGNEQYFCDLDGVAGDGDFGTSLATGFREIEAQWETLDRSSIGHMLLGCAQIITSKVGGCSGPIWGTAFMRAGMVARDKTELSGDDVSEIFERAIAGIQQRGGAEEGDKTLLDALLPMHRAFEANRDDDPLGACADAALKAVDDTKGLIARRGRQSFTGERSIGSEDPGTVAVALMTRNIQTKLAEMA